MGTYNQAVLVCPAVMEQGMKEDFNELLNMICPENDIFGCFEIAIDPPTTQEDEEQPCTSVQFPIHEPIDDLPVRNTVDKSLQKSCERKRGRPKKFSRSMR